MMTAPENVLRHAEPVTPAPFVRIERRLSEIHESGEQRVTIRRDAITDFTAAELELAGAKFAPLRNHRSPLNANFKQTPEVDQQVAEMKKRLDARQVARDEAKRVPKGNRGERGARIKRGLPGARGLLVGPPDQQTITPHLATTFEPASVFGLLRSNNS